MIKRGPVDVVVMAAGSPHLDGSVFAELKRQTAAGTIRVLDALILRKDENSNPWRLELRDLPKEQQEAIGYTEHGTFGLFDADDVATLFEGMVPGSGVAAFAIEHVWAIDLVNAVYNAGVETAFTYRVPAQVVDEAFASLPVNA